MAGAATEEPSAGKCEGVSRQASCQAGEAMAEWRSSEQVENGTPSTSPPYWDSDDDDDGGPKPSELFGKNTWKIEKFSQINKRELRSDPFDVGGYKWYILIYPQGCDVCNHLSLFLCVANHEKLLPGWSHFAQFTICVVNKDPKKSKYSDTLHRFWKKEHDWGWKKFMELSKLLDGFIDADSLTIKAQVQVLRERADRPFRCLDCPYRRELVRVYLTNVEQICRRFVEERRVKLGKLIDDKDKWSSFCSFWMGMDQSYKRRMSQEKTESILKIVVKHFFIEKEVTSTLVMDSLYSGLRALEGCEKGKKSKGSETEEPGVPIIRIEKDMFVLVDDVLLLLEKVSMEPLPPKDDKGPQDRTKDAGAGEELTKDPIEQEERRLTELGRRTLEVFILSHVFSKIEVAYQEAVALKRQEELIREEEEAWLAEIEQKARRAALDKEKKSKKKQAKQKRNNRKGKDKGKDEKTSSPVKGQNELDQAINGKDSETNDSGTALEKFDTVDVSDVSDSVDHVPEILPPDSDDRDPNPSNWDTDTYEIHPQMEACSSGIRGLSIVQNGSSSAVDDTDTSEVHPSMEACSSRISGLSNVQNGSSSVMEDIDTSEVHPQSETCSSEISGLSSVQNGRSSSAVDDSSSTCSSDSVPFVTVNASHKGNSQNPQNKKSSRRSRNYQSKAASHSPHWASEEPSCPSEAAPDSGSSIEAPQNSKAANCSSPQKALNGAQWNAHDKSQVQENGSSHRIARVISPPPVSVAPAKPEPKPTNDPPVIRKSSPKQADRSVSTHTSEKATAMKPDMPKVATPKPTAKPSGHVGNEKPPATTDKPSLPPSLVVSRPLSAPLIPGPKQPVSVAVPAVPTGPMLSRSVSAIGRLGPDSAASAAYIPQSYRNAILGTSAAGNLPSAQDHPVSSTVNMSVPYSQAPGFVSAPLRPDRVDPNPIRQSFSFGMMNRPDIIPSRTWTEFPERDGNRNMSGALRLNDLQQRFDGYGSVHRSRDPFGFPASTSTRQNQVVPDEFPHLDIINDLLDDEQGVGSSTELSQRRHGFGNGGHRYLNQQFGFLGDHSISNGPAGLSRSSRSFDHGYAASYDMIPQASPRSYVNGPLADNSLIPNHWQIPVGDLTFPNVRNADNNGYSYHIPEYTPNINSGNSYPGFRPSNGH
ncbi:TNF receptor-associated factor homolog 1b-like isoform X2 [Andrographis paniculata]|uniref:TNF receptor-associated factor homolog 1b-like isoform X2 n=1 Tax=Andrographis paniculata TaxID=175694 RepID=UPI0021E99C9E|nr:TNF receptor-associated factor homolog 1b-like isoform X2 [Andrographis paniculata]